MVSRYVSKKTFFIFLQSFASTLIKGFNYGVTIAGTTGVSGATASLLSSPTAITFDTNNFM
jgi:hypothetical protein